MHEFQDEIPPPVPVANPLRGAVDDTRDSEVKKETADTRFTFSDTSSRYNLMILCLNSFSDIFCAIYGVFFAGGILTNYNATGFLYNPSYTPTSAPTPAPIPGYGRGNQANWSCWFPPCDTTKGLRFAKLLASFFLVVWLLAELAHLLILMAFRVATGLHHAKVLAPGSYYDRLLYGTDPIVVAKRAMVVKLCSAIHYVVVLWATSGFVMQQYLFQNTASDVFTLTPIYSAAYWLMIFVILWIDAFVMVVIEQKINPMVYDLGGDYCGPLALLNPLAWVYIGNMLLFLFPFFYLQIVLVPLFYCLECSGCLKRSELLTSYWKTARAVGWRASHPLPPMSPGDPVTPAIRAARIDIANFLIWGYLFFALLLTIFCTVASIDMYVKLKAAGFSLDLAALPYSLPGVAGFWIATKVVQFIVALLVPLVRLYFQGKLKRLLKLLGDVKHVILLELIVAYCTDVLMVDVDVDAVVDPEAEGTSQAPSIASASASANAGDDLARDGITASVPSAPQSTSGTHQETIHITAVATVSQAQEAAGGEEQEPLDVQLKRELVRVRKLLAERREALEREVIDLAEVCFDITLSRGSKPQIEGTSVPSSV